MILSLIIIGAINWGLIGLFHFDVVATLFGGQTAFISRVIYTLIGISGLFSLVMLFEPFENDKIDSIKPEDFNYRTEFSEEHYTDDQAENDDKTN